MSQRRQKPQQPDLSFNEKEWSRLQALTTFEREARSEGFTRIAGLDEAGRGPLAGPVFAAACIVPEDVFISGINDSKKLSPKKRSELFIALTQNPQIHYGIGVVSSEEIDRINILQATIVAMKHALANLSCKPDCVFVDGLKLPHQEVPCRMIIGGDARSYSIAAASIIAKESRDKLMCEYHQKWPQYGFDKHKGYGTKVHREAIEKYGPCPIHRRTFEPVKSYA